MDGLAQGCSNSSVIAMELLQSCAKPAIYHIRLLATRPSTAAVMTTVLDIFLPTMIFLLDSVEQTTSLNGQQDLQQSGTNGSVE